MNKISSVSLPLIFFLVVLSSVSMHAVHDQNINDMPVIVSEYSECDFDALQAMADDANVVIAPPKVPSRCEKMLRKFGLPVAMKLVACKNNFITACKRIYYGN